MKNGIQPTFWGDLFDIAKEAFQAVFYSPSSSREIRPIEIIDVDKIPENAVGKNEIVIQDDTPEEIAHDKKQKAQNSALTFQYLNKLKINPSEKSTVVMSGSIKKGFKIESSAYAKYHSGDKAKTLAELMSLTNGLGKEAAERLLKNRWLGSSEVNDYFKLLTREHPGVFHIDSGENVDLPKFIARLKKVGSTEAINMRNANRIFWPICQDSHWYLIVMDKNKDHSYNVSCLDSLGWSREEIASKANTVLQALYPGNDQLIKKSKCIKVPEQHNLVDCGVAACYWGNKIINSKTLPKDRKGNCDYSQYRFDIAETFAKQKAISHIDLIGDDEMEDNVQPLSALEQLRNKKFR